MKIQLGQHSKNQSSIKAASKHDFGTSQQHCRASNSLLCCRLSVLDVIKHLFRQPAAKSLTLMKSFMEHIFQNIIFNMRASLIWSHDCTFSLRDGGRWITDWLNNVDSHLKSKDYLFSLSSQRRPRWWSFGPTGGVQSRLFALFLSSSPSLPPVSTSPQWIIWITSSSCLLCATIVSSSVFRSAHQSILSFPPPHPPLQSRRPAPPLLLPALLLNRLLSDLLMMKVC